MNKDSKFYFPQILKERFGKNINLHKINHLGEVSHVYKIDTEKQSFIVKTNSLDHFDIYKKEAWCLLQAKSIGISVPEVIDVKKFNNECLILLSFKKGENCSELREDILKDKVIEQLGKFAQKLSKIAPKENIADLKTIEDAKRWFYVDYLDFEIIQTSKIDDYLILSREDRNKCIEALKLLKNIEFEFGLCHGDLSLKNCLYEEPKNEVTLLDFGSAETQPKIYFEVMLKWLEVNYDKTLSQKHFEIFVSALLNENCESWLNSNFHLIKALALVYCLDKYRWAHDKSTKEWQENYKNRLTKIFLLI